MPRENLSFLQIPHFMPGIGSERDILPDVQRAVTLYVNYRTPGMSATEPTASQVRELERSINRLEDAVTELRLSSSARRSAYIHLTRGLIFNLLRDDASEIEAYQSALAIYSSCTDDMTPGFAWSLARIAEAYERTGLPKHAETFLQVLLDCVDQWQTCAVHLWAINAYAPFRDRTISPYDRLRISTRDWLQCRIARQCVARGVFSSYMKARQLYNELGCRGYPLDKDLENIALCDKMIRIATS